MSGRNWSVPALAEELLEAAAFPLEKEECTLRAVHGARTVPTDFCARSFVLSCRPEENARTFTCGEGRSSSAWMPWFGLDISPQRGWEIAIGWSGAWIAEFEAGSGEVRAAFGMEDSRFRMMPGETFRLPGLLLFQREGMSPMAFQSVIRAFMIRHKSPRDSRGNIIKPCMPVTGSGGNRPSDFHIRLIERFGTGDYPFDTFWIDAGWYGPPRQPDLSENYGRDWPYVVGDWRVNPGSHPRGLRPVAEAARIPLQARRTISA